ALGREPWGKSKHSHYKNRTGRVWHRKAPLCGTRPFTTANGPFVFLHGTHHCAALASSQVQRTRARTRELDMESIREHSDGLEQNRQGGDGLAPHNRQGHARCCFEAVSPEVPRARSGSGGFHEASTSRVIDCR